MIRVALDSNILIYAELTGNHIRVCLAYAARLT